MELNINRRKVDGSRKQGMSLEYEMGKCSAVGLVR